MSHAQHDIDRYALNMFCAICTGRELKERFVAETKKKSPQWRLDLISEWVKVRGIDVKVGA